MTFSTPYNISVFSSFVSEGLRDDDCDVSGNSGSGNGVFGEINRVMFNCHTHKNIFVLDSLIQKSYRLKMLISFVGK